MGVAASREWLAGMWHGRDHKAAQYIKPAPAGRFGQAEALN